jgi:predicted MPP superfamily phosphohydrolase
MACAGSGLSGLGMQRERKKIIVTMVWYGAGLFLFLLIIYGVWIEPNRIEIHEVTIHDEYFAGILGNKTVVQITDLHIGGIGRREKKVLEFLDTIKPDIIFLTGDYVRWNGEYEPALSFLSLLNAKIGVWAVMGDYDYINSRKSCIFCHEEGTGRLTRKHKVRFLKDSMEEVRLPEGTLKIEGFDGEGGEIVSRDKEFKTPDTPCIILSHSPLNFERIEGNQHVLMLAGDTHGGQAPLPGWLFKVLGYRKNALYNQGLFEKDRKKMFVSRGIGTSHIPFRLFRSPEIVVFHFISP